MLFNSFPFLLFLPVVLVGYYIAVYRFGAFAAAGWMLIASLVFYSGWGLSNLLILIISITINYGIARAMAHMSFRRTIFISGLAFNLLLLGYYKYAAFFSNTLAPIAHVHFVLESIKLPVGISFFTFTQIAYLVDMYRKTSYEPNGVYYGLFVSYFPHLVAGPILHHAEMIPQFKRRSTSVPNVENVVVGFSIFLMGLAKKVLLADSVAPCVDLVFDGHKDVASVQAWGGVLCYCMQIYFDFSGYSDMAVGISKMFGILLPINFNSPYKSASIIEFWRRWHMTLSRFLRDYLYIPLGGSRKGPIRRYANLMCTMVLGGIWHGAGWTFAFWGFLHGLYLVINRLWHTVFDAALLHGFRKSAYRYASCLLTFSCVTFAWIFFRAPTFSRAIQIVGNMLGSGMNQEFTLAQTVALGRFLLLFAIAVLLPNTQQLFASFRPALGMEAVSTIGERWRVRLSAGWGFLLGVLAFMIWQEMVRTDASPFLYFQF